MSAFVVEDGLIDFLLHFAREVGHYPNKGAHIWLPVAGKVAEVKTHEALTELGQMLIAENYRSVNYRYSESDAPHAYTWKPHAAFRPLADDPGKLAATVGKCTDCFDYQACETPDYYHTDAAAVMDALRKAALSQLPAYDAAEWGEPKVPPREQLPTRRTRLL